MLFHNCKPVVCRAEQQVTDQTSSKSPRCVEEHNYSLSNSHLQPNSWGGKKSKEDTKIRICLHTKIRDIFCSFIGKQIPLRSEMGSQAKIQNSKAVWKNQPAREKKAVNTQEPNLAALATAENRSGNISLVILSSPCCTFRCLWAGAGLINNLLGTKGTSEINVQAFVVLFAFSHWQHLFYSMRLRTVRLFAISSLLLLLIFHLKFLCF